MSILDILYGLIFQPQTAMRELARTRPLLPAFLVFVTVYAANYLLREAGRSITQIETGLIPASMAGLIAALGAIAAIAVWFVSAGLFSLLAEIIYGYGNGRGVLACLGFASFPGIFGSALYYLAILLNLNSWGMLFYVITVLWVIGLQVLAVREAFTLATAQAIFIYALPVVLFLAVIVMLTVMGGIVLTSLPLF